MKYQWVVKNMQHTCEDVFLLSEQFYETYEEAIAEIEKEGPEFIVVGKFIPHQPVRGAREYTEWESLYRR